MKVEKKGNSRTLFRQRLFTVVALSIPLLFFLLLEAGLRLAGYGHSYPLFLPVAEAPGFLQANPNIVKRFVIDEFATPNIKIHATRFPEQKAPGTFRVVVQGGSTAAGFPYGYGASLAGMLQQRLQATYPDVNFEIITTAMPAVNSYTLLDFTDEIIRQQPDAVLIYAGHNEYLGILGVGSALSAGRSRPVILTLLALRESRILQLLMHTYQVTTSGGPVDVEAITNSSGTLMRRIVGKRHIPIDSVLYREGEQQFHSNLASLLARYRDAGIPVFIGTLASNEKGMAPFISELAADTDAAVWQAKYAAGSEALQQGELETAHDALTEVVALDDIAASGYFALGQLLENLGDYPSAREAYLAAKDRDQLRFRAPEAFNSVIRQLAAGYDAHVVEVQASLLEAAGHGIIGNDLMLEHLHPNLLGYFLLADAYFDALREQGVVTAREQTVDREQAWKEIPITNVDRLNGKYQILHLKGEWPFPEGAVTEPRPRIPGRPSVEEQIAHDLYREKITWTTAMHRLLAHYENERDRSSAAQVAVLLADTHQYEEAPQLKAGILALQVHRYRDAARLFRRALQHSPDQVDYLASLARACHASADEVCVAQTLDQLRTLDTGSPQVRTLFTELDHPMNP
ncbi:MAG: tetratricopeptide repeat protein [Gammaproteobacteria bacterium]|nr:tetratricopeptide repeat protein [Gammaproteobacteria bacterium]